MILIKQDQAFNRALLDFLAKPANHANFYDLYFSSNTWLTLCQEFIKQSRQRKLIPYWVVILVIMHLTSWLVN
ncbi:hypothetical protein D3C76_476440 [compost metagenome]